MKIYFLIAILLLSLNCQAQKIFKNTTDKFTKERLLETKIEKFAYHNKWKSLFPNQTAVHSGIRYSNGDWRLLSTLIFEDCEKIDDGDGIIILLENGETITLPSIYTGVAHPTKRPGLDWWEFETVFKLNQDEVNLLKEYAVTDIRILTINRKFDIPVPSNKQNLIQSSICIIEQLLENDKAQKNKANR